MYIPAGELFKVSVADLEEHKSWMNSINSRLPAGSDYFMEIAHNGNGNIEVSLALFCFPGTIQYSFYKNAIEIDESLCGEGPIEYDEPDYGTPVEFVKPPGTGTTLWPEWAQEYPYTDACTNSDETLNWWQDPSNLNAFAHISRK